MHFPSRSTPLFVAAMAVALAACSGEDKKPATQVAARVNQQEISVHQINAMMARAGQVPPEAAKDMSRQVLDRLIDQEVLVQKAMEKKLDRDPRIMQAIESARRDILSRSYMEQVAAAASRPTSEEVRDYYAKHPELFGQRRLYQFQEMAIQGSGPEFLAKLQQKVPTFKSMRDIATWLNAEGVKFAVNATTKAAEQLPLELLPRIHQMKDGQFGLVPARDGVMVMQLVASRSAPTDEATATPFIEQFLGNKSRTEAVEREVKALRALAKVEYMGEFTAAAQDKAKADELAGAQEKAKADEKAKAEAAARAEEKVRAEERALAEAKARAESRAKLAESAAKEATTTGKPAVPAVSLDKGLSGLK